MAKKKITIEDLAYSVEGMNRNIEGLTKKMTTLESLPGKVEVLAKKIDTLASKKDLERFATKKDLEILSAKTSKLEAKLIDVESSVDNLAIMTKEGFDSVDLRFAIVDDRFNDTNKRMDRMENKIDDVREEVIKNGDAFTKLKRYVDSETAAVISHLKRVDEKIGLAT